MCLGVDHTDRHLDQTPSFLSWEKYLGCTSPLGYSMPLQQPELGWTWETIKPALKSKDKHIRFGPMTITEGRKGSKREWRRISTFSVSFWSTPTLFVLGGGHCPLGTGLCLAPSQCQSKQTYHMIMITSFITISFRMLKNSTISLACSPIFPMAMPKAMKNPIRPVGKRQMSQDKGQSLCFLLLTLQHERKGVNSACHSLLNKLEIRRKKHSISHWKPPRPHIL